MAGGPTRITRYAYDAHGTRTQMIASDGTTTDYRYDRRSRLRELVQRSAAAAILFSATYTTDAAGLRTGIEEADATGTTRTVAYTYDATRRLTQETIAHRDATRDRTTAWTYDRVGNRLTQVTTTGSGTTQSTTTVTSEHDANDRPTREEEREGTGAPRITTTTYDANGNTIRKDGPDGVTEYAWDDANRLTEQRTASGRTEYRYDADGLRIGQTTYPTTGTPTRTDHLVDPTYAYANVIERWEGEGAASPKLTAVHVFGEGIVGQTTCTPTATSAATDCPNATERVLHADGFGSTRYLTNAAGTITDRIDYDAFGTEIHREGDTDVEHLYRGEQYDANLRFYYLRARYMDPARGRFASMDPFAGFSSDPMSLHKYVYAHANAVNNVDPTGYLSLSEMVTTINTSIAVANNAVTAYNWIFGNPDSDAIDGIPGIWDIIMSMAVRGLSGTVAASPPPPSNASNWSGDPEKHHVIAVYCCGHINGRRSSVPYSLHRAIHDDLNDYKIAINLFGMTVDLLVYKRPSSRIVKTPLQRLGMKAVGRTAIAAGLLAFYTQYDYLAVGTPTIGASLAIETPRYIGRHHSAPACQRPQRP